MAPDEFKIDDGWWRVTRLSAHKEFKVERHTKSSGWGVVMQSVAVSEDDTLLHDVSLDEEIVQCCETAIGAFTENEERLYRLVPEIDVRSRAVEAVQLIERYGQIDGGHHKMWVIDQIVRLLTEERYPEFLEGMREEDSCSISEWDEGTPP